MEVERVIIFCFVFCSSAVMESLLTSTEPIHSYQMLLAKIKGVSPHLREADKRLIINRLTGFLSVNL